jgi:hypothetical protein
MAEIRSSRLDGSPKAAHYRATLPLLGVVRAVESLESGFQSVGLQPTDWFREHPRLSCNARKTWMPGTRACPRAAHSADPWAGQDEFPRLALRAFAGKTNRRLILGCCSLASGAILCR